MDGYIIHQEEYPMGAGNYSLDFLTCTCSLYNAQDWTDKLNKLFLLRSNPTFPANTPSDHAAIQRLPRMARSEAATRPRHACQTLSRSGPGPKQTSGRVESAGMAAQR